MIYRSVFTNHLLTELAGFALPVGDNDAPSEPHGWQGEPNENLANFIPWLVLSPGNATRSQGTFDDPQDLWQLTYFVSSAGISRLQAENVADRVRTELKGLAKQNILLKTDTWRLMYVHVTGIGGVNRIGATNPAHHVQTDTFEFWLSKEN